MLGKKNSIKWKTAELLFKYQEENPKFIQGSELSFS